MKKNLSLALLLSLLLSACAAGPYAAAPASVVPAAPAAAVQTAPVAPAPVAIAPERLAQDLPFDKTIIKGKLANGLTYYIRQNPRPEKRAEIWLAVDAGSVLEDEDQRGLAHFIEHMAFNGTKRFEKMELVNYLESIGMQFGADVNASTSFDETIYTLRVPTDRPEVMKKAFEILEDWAGAVSFDADEVNKERGVVIEEWRLGRGAEARIEDKQLPILFKGSRYADRLPIGTLEVLEKATPEQLRRYYKDWYRPDLMAVVIVGDVDPAQMEGMVKEHFGGLANPASARPRQLYDVPTGGGTRVAITTDPEATDTTVGIYSVIDKRPEGSVGDYRQSLIENLYHDMLNSRLRELTQGGVPPFSWAGSSAGRFVRTRDVLFQMVAVPEGGIQEGLEALLTEVERVRRHGFTASELERAKKELILFYDQAEQENGKLDSANFAAEYLRNFFENEPVPGIAYEVDLVREVMPTIQLPEVNRLAEEWTGGDRIILLSAPETQKARLPAEKELLGTFQQVTARQINPWVDRVRQGPLVAEAPKPGRIVSESRVEELNVTEWRLSNGVRVLLKPTDFQNDEILLTSYSPGGSSLVPDSKYLSAAFATAVIRDAGLGRFDRVTLEKALAGKAAGVLPYIGTFEEGIRGVAAARDLETMFQLVYLNVTAPRKDPKLFLSLLGGLEEQLRTRVSSPEAVFADELRKAMAQGNPRQEPLSIERLREINFETAYEVYRDRFADAGDFTFVLVGNFTPESIKPLVLTWLGGLPTKGRRESWRDPGDSTTFDSVVKVDVAKGLEPKSQVRMLFSGPATFTRENRHVMESLARVLQIRLREVLREDMGAVYGVEADGGLSSRPRGEYSFHIGFGCAPEKVDSLVQAVFAEIESIQKNGVPDGYLQKVREQERREREVAVQENRFWLGALEAYASEGWDLRDILRYDQLVSMVTSERLQQAAQTYFHRDRYLLGVLRPEAPAAAQTAPAANTTTGR